MNIPDSATVAQAVPFYKPGESHLFELRAGVTACDALEFANIAIACVRDRLAIGSDGTGRGINGNDAFALQFLVEAALAAQAGAGVTP